MPRNASFSWCPGSPWPSWRRHRPDFGWVMAGRVLRPLRTITATARHISALDLDRRLALHGPGDELKELADTFDGLLARLQASFAAQRQFIGNVSHELRTPLARQRVLTQVALADPDATTGSLRTAHERVLASGRQQERLIEALLTLALSQRASNARNRSTWQR
jgi:signal transduction histidine kinase